MRPQLLHTSPLLLLLAFGPGCQHGRVESPEIRRIQKVDQAGHVQAEYTTYQDSKGREIKHGLYVGFYQDGTKYCELNYEHGIRDGRCTLYSIDGRQSYTGYFRKGKPWEGDIQLGERLYRFDNGRLIGVWGESGLSYLSNSSHIRCR